METVTTGNPLLFLIVVILFFGFIGFVLLNNFLGKKKRKNLIRAFRAAPVIKKDGPILVQGPAVAPDRVLPTTGEHVAFYGLFVLSRESAITSIQSHHHAGTLSIGNVPVGYHDRGRTVTDTRILDTKGFRFFDMSGDFLVSAQGTQYRVNITGVFEQFIKGASLVTPLAVRALKEAGFSDDVINNTTEFLRAGPALKTVCGFDVPLHENTSSIGNDPAQTTFTTVSPGMVKSRIDARIQNFRTGKNLPQGIVDLLTKRSIVPENNEEIIVIETFIPLNREVWVFGTYDGDNGISLREGTAQLTVSYTDPGEE